MIPRFGAIAVSTWALALAIVSSDRISVAATKHPTALQAAATQWHRGTIQSFGIGSNNYNLKPDKSKRNFDDGYLEETYIPPWRDPVTTSPTLSPTTTPTRPPTAIPTFRPTGFPTNNPTKTPTAVPAPVDATATPVDISVSGSLVNTAFDEESGREETSCELMPSIGTFVSEVLDIEYFLYVEEEGINEEVTLQTIIDSTIEPQLHDALVDIGLSCESSNYVIAKHVMVNLTSGGNALVGAQCLVDNTDGLLANATAAVCYQVWSQIEATMWFAPARRQRQLQSTTTPFGDREAFNQFTEWMREAFESLDGSDQFLLATFRGFVNVNDFDGSTHDELNDVGTDITSAFMGTAYSVDDRGINLVFGLIAIIAGVMIFAFVILFVIIRRKRNQAAFMEHAKCVEELALDSKDDLNDTADLVDDESLFGENRPLPEDLKVKLESADHDYRWVGEERKNPIFVATERNANFRDHLNVLQQRKDEEERARQYESVML